MITKKKIMTLLLATVMCITGSMRMFAAVSLPSISSGRPVKCYTLKSSGRIYAYTAANLRNRTGGYIDCASDECSILRISGNAVQVKYPVGRGMRTAWFARNEFSNCNMAKGAAERWTQNSQVTTYQRADGRTSYGYISAGDTCYKLSESGNYKQVIYPVSGGYKMGWISKGSSSAQNSFTVFGQKDKRWKNVSYGKGPDGEKATLSGSGCGILAYVNAVYYMTGNFIQPSELASWSVNHGYRINGQGTAMGLYQAFADECGEDYGFQYAGSKRKVKDARSHLQNGGTAIIHVDGHLMALVAYDGNNGKYLILDSLAHKNSRRGTGSSDDGAGYRWLKESEFKGRLAVSEIRLLSKNK